MRVFAPETLDFLRSHSFPGDVRELRYAIEQAVILSEEAALTPAHFASMRAWAERPTAPGARPRTRPITEEVSRERLRGVLQECGGNRVRAARALGISRATLYRLLGRESAKEPGEQSGSV